MRRYVGLWPKRALLICDLWRGGGTREVASRFLVPGDWTHGDGFAQDGITVRPSAPLGTLSGVAPDRCWPRFGVETPAYGFTLTPESRAGDRAAALLLCWGEAPAIDAAALAGRLAEAVR